MKFVLLVFMFCLPAIAALAQKKEEETLKPAQSLAQLYQQLEKILQDTHTPGLSVTIVHRDGPEWVAGLGKSNVAANQPATDETLFRIGSVSKGFVSLAILKLVDEGRLSLNDPVHKLVPEIWFQNRWELTDPVRVVDLLEHTTGWDDMHLREYARNGKGMSLREGLDYDHHSRISRWRPGTRMAYCNSGPWVAAYIVEKITGQSFENYVTQNLFLPIGMKTATYFEQPSPQLTVLYHSDGKTPYPYWNMMERPSGAINASARDMAAYVQFYLNRGAVSGTQVVPSVSIERMETPTRTWQAQEGLKAGYGLSNYTSVYEGFVYHGHSGGNPGLTEMGYMPEYDVGYSYSINADKTEAFAEIGHAIRAYVTRGLTRPPIPVASELPADAQQYAGWYAPASPRSEWTGFLEPSALHRIHFERGNLVFSNLFGTIHESFVTVGGAQFRFLPAEGPAQPIATAALLVPNTEGRFVYLGTTWFGTTWKRVPTWFAVAEVVLVVWFLLALVSVMLYAPFWIFGGLIKKRRLPAERAMRLLPLIAVLSLIAALSLFVQSRNDAIVRLGNLTIWSFGIFLTTLIFGAASIASAVALWLARKQEIRSHVRQFSMAVTSALLIATAYFAYWGVMGIHTWF